MNRNDQNEWRRFFKELSERDLNQWEGELFEGLYFILSDLNNPRRLDWSTKDAVKDVVKAARNYVW